MTPKKYDFLIVGAGLSGITLANLLANKGKEIILVDKKNHIGGACYDYLEDKILVQKYGPHIFHTDNKQVFDYLSKFTEWTKYKHKVLAFYKNKYYPVPINLNTVNLYFGLNLKTSEDLKKFLDSKKESIKKIENSEQLAVSEIGKELYNAFIKHFTKKTWGKYPKELDSSILKRVSVRYDKNDQYFNQKYQGLPKFGYTAMFNKMLDKKNIKLSLDTDFKEIKNKIKYKKIIYTGKIDEFLNYKFGKLGYRKIDFTFEKLDKKSFQENSVVNYTDKDSKFARITEFKKFYNIDSQKTILCKEKFNRKAEDFYPILNKKNLAILDKYQKEAKKIKNVMFFGKMAKFKYLDMDQTVEAAFEKFRLING